MAPAVTLRKANPDDAAALAAISQRAFDSDIDFGAPGPGGPPGYDDPAWQRRMMRTGDYYAVLSDGELVGGTMVSRMGDGVFELTRIFLDPARYRQGIGTRAMALTMERYPEARRWILDTPTWNSRSRAFYLHLGFEEYGRRMLGGGFELTLYHRILDAEPSA
jgi:RimJ/RimL family protein N-acetyltransferase